MKLSLLVTAFAAASASATPLFKVQFEDDSKALFSGGRRGREGEESTISQRLKEEKNFSRFYDYLQQDKGLRDDLDSQDMHSTVFAPCNEAFEDMERMAGHDSDKMRDILKYHIAGDSEITEDCMHAGALIPSNLKLKSLGDRHQRIRVYKFNNHIWLVRLPLD
ncbi:hypothetical protein HKX48_001003 [Thoreauomyces humboldtii]|nr:hypothetical protein HKX48_001003 [Thoreauomyces humboldtii]